MRSRKAIVLAGASPSWRSKNKARLLFAMGVPALVIAMWRANPAEAGDCVRAGQEASVQSDAGAGQTGESAVPHDPCAGLAAATEANLRKTVSLNFSAIRIRSLLNLLSDASDVYMYATESVSGSVSITVANASVKKILADLVQSRRWIFRTVNDSVVVGPPAEVNEAIEKKLFWSILPET